MKIRAAEIAAAKDADTRLSTVDAVRILNAVLKVRRARKQAKRERQRKEKNKQVVESVQWSAEELDRMKAMPITGKDPINKLPPLVGSVKGIPIERGMNETERADLERKTAEMMRYLSTLSKAPEWDGTFGVGEWMTRDGSFATVTSVEPDYLTGNLCGIPWTWNLDVTLKNPDDDNSLLRPWPKGEQ